MYTVHGPLFPSLRLQYYVILQFTDHPCSTLGHVQEYSRGREGTKRRPCTTKPVNNVEWRYMGPRGQQGTVVTTTSQLSSMSYGNTVANAPPGRPLLKVLSRVVTVGDHTVQARLPWNWRSAVAFPERIRRVSNFKLVVGCNHTASRRWWPSPSRSAIQPDLRGSIDGRLEKIHRTRIAAYNRRY